MKRMMMMVALAAFLVAALSVSALSAFAAQPTCEPDPQTGEIHPGCKTSTDTYSPSGNPNATENNVQTTSRLGNGQGQGTEDTQSQTCTHKNGQPRNCPGA